MLRIAEASFALLLVASVLLLGTAAQAGGVVTNCANDTDFSSKLIGGGTVTFNCGTATIPLLSAKTISVDTTIDGEDVITLSGRGANRLFVVNSGVTLTLKNITLTDGHAADDGGAIYNAGHLILEHATIVYSFTDSAHSGGAIVTYGPLDISDSYFAQNSGANGGAIFARFPNAPVTITGSTLAYNDTTDTTNGWGGAILLWDGATVNIAHSEIRNNEANVGGAINNRFANSSMTIEDTEIRDNSSTMDGGAIYALAGTTTLTDVLLSGNSTVSGSGGGLFNSGTATLTNVTLSSNPVAVGGGGIYNLGTLTLTNSTLWNNTALYGGGIYNVNTATLTNVTLSANSASSNGGGILNFNIGAIHLTLTNVIVANSTAGGNCSFPNAPDSSSFNLSTDNTCNFGAGRDGIPDMKLGPLADNGGLTPTHALLAGSPAIDAGKNSGCPATDQRSFFRADGLCDVGAVEYGATLNTPTPSPTPSHTSSPTPTTSPSPTPSPTATAAAHKQGDLDCNNAIDGRDALRPMLAAVGLPMGQPGGCPALNSRSPQFADVNCDLSIGPPDTVAILEYAANVAIKPTSPPRCTPIGELLS